MATKTLSMSKLVRKYKPFIMRKFAEVRQEMEENGYVGADVFDRTDEEYSWGMDFRPADADPDDEENGFAVEITIIESKVRDGEDDFGVGFSMNVGGFGGEIIGGCTPYNYTPDVWVSRKDPEKVWERWQLFDHGADACEVLAVVQQHYAAKAGK